MQAGPRASGLAALAAFAMAIRVAAVFAVGSYKLEHVTYEHGEIARNLVEGRGFVVRWMGAEGPTSQQAPVYPALVAVFYRIFGAETPAALLALQLFQCALGGILTACVVMLARELLPKRQVAGWLGGIGTAVYPTLVYAATQVQVASLATTLVVVVILAAAQASRFGSMLHAIVTGTSAGLLVLTDPILGLVVVVAIWVIWKGVRVSTVHAQRASPDNRNCEQPAPIIPSSLRGTQYSVLSTRREGHADSPNGQFLPRFPFASLQLIAVTLAAFAAVVTPWIVRNYLVHGEFVLVKSTFGYAFWQGNHPRSFGTDKIPLPSSSNDAERPGWGLRALEQSLWRTRMVDTLYIDDAVLPNERIAELGLFSEPERSRQLMAEVAAYIRQHPEHYLRLCLQRLRYFLLFDETNPKSRVWVYRASHLALQAMALAGLWLSRRSWRQLWPTYLVFALVTVFHTLTIVSARFHIPLETIQIVWAGFGAAEVGRMAGRLIGVRSRRSQPEMPMAAAA